MLWWTAYHRWDAAGSAALYEMHPFADRLSTEMFWFETKLRSMEMAFYWPQPFLCMPSFPLCGVLHVTDSFSYIPLCFLPATATSCQGGTAFMRSLLRRGDFGCELGDACASLAASGHCVRVCACTCACVCAERDEALTWNPDSWFCSRVAPAEFVYSTHILAVLRSF